MKREIELLSSDDSAFFIHIDKKRDIRNFADLQGENVSFIDDRISVYWAEFSGVRATLRLMQRALNDSRCFEYLFLLSGSEYPIRSRRYIESFLEANRGSEFIRIIKVPAPGKPLSRVTTIRYESDKPVRRFASRALAKIGLAQRDYRMYLGCLEPYSGRTWWALTRRACEYILCFAEQNPQITRFFQDTFAPEEAFIHTILGNSEFLSKARGNLVYEDWSVGASHPAQINERHIVYFESREKVEDLSEGPSELLFARKFSDDRLDLLDRIDAMIERKGKNSEAPTAFSIRAHDERALPTI